MKLFAKYNRINVLATIFIFVVGSVAFYFALQYILIKQLDETLHSEQQEIHEYAEVHHQLPDIQNTKHQWVTITPTDKPLLKRKIGNYRYYNEREKEWETARQLLFSLNINQQYYIVSVSKSEVETEILLKLVILVTIGMVALILLLNFFLNRSIINRLWQPFYYSVDQIRKYEIKDKQSLSLPRNSVNEFNLLNESLNSMTQRIEADYLALKAFTENASHEMQTPLAVIRSKTDMLLQQSELKEEAIKNILGIEDSIQKLTRLNQSLLLLTKLENTQFALNEEVNISELIEQKLEEKKELFLSRKIDVGRKIEPLVLLFHQQLAEILLNNFLSNAIKYTPAGGMINVELNSTKLVVTNTAANGSLEEDKIFQRFYKAQPNQEGVGLGLAIVFEIARAAGFSVSYSFTNNQHIFSVHFNWK